MGGVEKCGVGVVVSGVWCVSRGGGVIRRYRWGVYLRRQGRTRRDLRFRPVGLRVKYERLGERE